MSDGHLLTRVGTHPGTVVRDLILLSVAKQGVQGVQGVQRGEHFVVGETAGGSIFCRTMPSIFA